MHILYVLQKQKLFFCGFWWYNLAYFVGAVGSLLAEGDRVRVEKDGKIEQAHQFCVSKRLPGDLSHAVLTHTKYHCQHNFMFDEMKVLETLPTYLRFCLFVYTLC